MLGDECDSCDSLGEKTLATDDRDPSGKKTLAADDRDSSLCAKTLAADDRDSLGTKTLPDDRDSTGKKTLADDRDSLGTLTMPWSIDSSATSPSDCGNASGPYALPVSLSDVSFFGHGPDDDDDEPGHRAGGPPQTTLAIVKPEAAHLMYKIESLMERNGFVVQAKGVFRLTREQAAEFYSEQVTELYFPRLIDHMSSGPIAAYVLAKRDCVNEWRRLIGPANVSCAKRLFPVSLRAVYGTERGTAPVANAFHGSDSPAAARREIRFFFPNVEVEGMDDVEDTVQYIESVMMPTITEGLKEMFKNSPIDPLRWFGNWLLTRSTQNT